ncbi:MAG TPA: hypothetical protein VFI42_16645 [Thermomicrobiaceae bacterium]|nr:hypothetical protein [Thermomicrobiaceae bacterium]
MAEVDDGAGRPPTGSGSGGSRLSRHPTDLLIRELIATKRAATEAEIDAIIERMATAPFNQQVVRVPTRIRGVSYQGQTLGTQADSLFLHLVRRVVEDQQWALGTTEQEYLADLRAAIRDPAARLLVYERQGGPIAVILAPSNVPPSRRGPTALPLFVVVYSADHGSLISGYLASSQVAVNVPGDARWLR